VPDAKNGAIAGFSMGWGSTAAGKYAKGSQNPPNIGLVPNWPGQRFALAFLFRAP
jgi:hypothetical protein